MRLAQAGGVVYVFAIMRTMLRQGLVILVAVSLAFAGSAAPKHAHAKGQNPHPAVHGGSAVHVHAKAKEHHAHATTVKDSGDSVQPCHPVTVPSPEDSFPLSNCCVASCAAIAHIVASVVLLDVLHSHGFVTSRAKSLELVSRTSDDPPPR